MEKVLRETGAQVITAYDGNDALKAALEHDFALAALGVQMPEMDGDELAELMRGMGKTKNLPIIFLSTAYNVSSCKTENKVDSRIFVDRCRDVYQRK